MNKKAEVCIKLPGGKSVRALIDSEGTLEEIKKSIIESFMEDKNPNDYLIAIVPDEKINRKIKDFPLLEENTEIFVIEVEEIRGRPVIINESANFQQNFGLSQRGISQQRIQHIKKGERIMGSKKEISLGDHASFAGDFVVADTIENSFNKAASANIPDNLKELLKQLATTVSKVREQLPKEKADQLANDLQTFMNEAISKTPRRRWWELSAEGIKEASKTVGEIGLSALKNLDKIIPIIENLS